MTDFDKTGIFEGDRGPTIQTSSGRRFHLLDPRPEDIHMEDICGPLSRLCRFSGQCDQFYSVAQHSIICASYAEHHTNCGREGGRIMLLHDAAEAYLGDITRPLKSLLPQYQEIEAKVWDAIVRRFELDREMFSIIKSVDNQVLASEKNCIFTRSEKWPGLPEPEIEIGFVMSPEQARMAYEVKARRHGLL